MRYYVNNSTGRAVMLSDIEEKTEKAFKSCSTGNINGIRTGIILGSGLSGVRNSINGKEIPFSEIEGFPAPGVKGHSGILKISQQCAVLAGRFHFYEGHGIDDVVLPVFLLKKLGVENLIITNAAGGINRSYSPGELVLISDHLNLTGVNPLIGKNIEKYGPRFPDMSSAYSKSLIDRALEIKPGLKKGVYAGLTGPSYETPAEVRMLAAIGADLVGMSTVNEVIAARYLGINVLGISCVTNMAAGILEKPLDHGEVIDTGKKAEAELTGLVLELIRRLI